MYKIIGADKREYGPVTAEQLRQWAAEGRVNGQTLVRGEDVSEWKTLATLPEFAEALGAQPGPPPLVGAVAPPLDSAAWTAQILARQPQVQVGRCLSLSWELLTANFGLLFGAAFVIWAIDVACRFIPFVGPLSFWVLRGVLYGGLYLVVLSRIRGQPASVGDTFAGFRVAFAQLLLAGALTSLLTSIGTVCCLLLPGLYLFIAWLFSVPLVVDKRLEFWSAMELSRKVVTRVWFEVFGLFLVAFLPVILAYLFVQVKIGLSVFPLIQEMLSSGPPDLQHLLPTIQQVAASSFLLTLLAKFVFLLNLPFALGALMYAYENLFGARTAPTA